MTDDHRFLDDLLGEATISKTNKKYQISITKGVVKSLSKQGDKPLILCDHVFLSNITHDKNRQLEAGEDYTILIICCVLCSKQFHLTFVK